MLQCGQFCASKKIKYYITLLLCFTVISKNRYDDDDDDDDDDDCDDRWRLLAGRKHRESKQRFKVTFKVRLSSRAAVRCWRICAAAVTR